MSQRITIQPSGHSFEAAADENLLDAGLREGFAIPYGCRNGACGSCMATLLDGEVDYRGEAPPGLSERDIAAGKVLLCQAHANSDVQLEIREIGAARDIQVKVLLFAANTATFRKEDGLWKITSFELVHSLAYPGSIAAILNGGG